MVAGVLHWPGDLAGSIRPAARIRDCMPKRSKPANSSRNLPPVPVAPGSGIARIVEGLLAFLNRHQRDRTEGVHALLVAFVQAGIQALEDCDSEETDVNREALLAMLDHARRVLGDSQPAQQPSRWTVH